jgi:O-antigen ligase
MEKPGKILIVILVTVFLFPVLAQAEFFVRKFLGPIPMPSFFLMLAIFFPILWKEFFKNGFRDLAEVYLNTLKFTIPFFMVAVIAIIWGLHPDAHWEEGFRNIAMDLFHWILLIISITIAQYWAVKKYHRIIFLFVLAGAGAAVWVDHFNPGTFSYIEHRAAGFTSNANDGARLIVLLCIAAVDWNKNELMNLIVLTFSGLTVFLTLSVGGLALYLSVLGYYLFLNIKGGKEDNFLKKVFLAIAVPLLVMFVIQPMLSNMRESSDSFDNKTAQKRLDKIAGFFSGDFSSYAKDHDRKELVDDYWEFIFEAPVAGQGTGFSTTRTTGGTHNMYLKHWVENGLLGLLLYTSLLIGAFWHFFSLKDKRGKIFVFVFFWSGFLSHNLLHDKTVVVLLGIFGTLAYLNNPKPQKQESRQQQFSPLWQNGQ